jgi:S1-C subfamily serine protease
MTASATWPQRVEQFFSGLMVECWRDVMPEAVTEQEADFLGQQLRLAQGARVLDVPCGPPANSSPLPANPRCGRSPDRATPLPVVAVCRPCHRRLRVG